MAYVVTDACIRCKYMDCVSVCPTECFHEGATMLVIDPSNCIDCAVCVSECPAGAIVADVETGVEQWIELNARMAPLWPNIADKGEAPADADAWKGVDGKFEAWFTEAPGGRA